MANSTRTQKNVRKANLVRLVGRVAFACGLLTGTLAMAAPLNLVQYPPGSGGKEPAPNVIVSIDNSGSMAWNAAGGTTISASNPSRMTSLKAALLTQFGDTTTTPPSKGKIEDNRMRLAWQSMWDASDSSSYNASKLDAGALNSMKPFSGTHRSNFTNFVKSLRSDGGTPSHKMLDNAYNYMKTAQGTNSPWADNPGTPQDSSTYKDCRRTYHIFMTDGAWSSGQTTKAGNADGTNTTLPNPFGKTPNRTYSMTSDQTRVYRDTFGGTIGTGTGTLSDLAFRAWAEDLQPNMNNNVRPLLKKDATEAVWVTPPNNFTSTCTTANNCTPLEPFWNPRNNPAEWQHIAQYNIGFGSGAANWNAKPDWVDTGNPKEDNFGGDYAKLVNGLVTWGNPLADASFKEPELWHSALNGRGRYYPAIDATALENAFADILDNIIIDTSKPLVSIAANSSSLRLGLNAYIAGYDAEYWSGKLTARAIDATTGSISSTDAWNVSTSLDAANYAYANRFLLSYDGTSGVAWNAYATLPAVHKTLLTKNSAGTVDTNGELRFNYLRGDRSKEASKSGGIFRNRGATLLGDIVNSNIWYTGKPGSGYNFNNYETFRSTLAAGGTSDTQLGGRIPMVYVGANDGMLHGFVANNWPTEATPTMAGGKELLAYIPQGIAQGNLRKLTDTTYSHQYYVDGSPFTGDAYIGTTPKWTTVLVGSLGAGGKGYFVLDVTDPSKFTNTNAASLVLLDTTATTDADIGNIVTPPVIDDANTGKSRQIVRMNNGRWAAVMGNGVNSTNEAAVLLIQYLDGDKALKKVSPCGNPIATTNCTYKGDNGLSSPQLIDLNGNDKVDIAYAGDIKGNLWKFDLTSNDDTQWAAVKWKDDSEIKPFFVTKTDTLAARPITTAPYWMQHPKGGIMLLVSTGRNLTLADQTTTETNTIFGLHDNSAIAVDASTGIATLTNTTAINSASSTPLLSTLLEQQTITGSFADAGTTYYQGSSNVIGTGKRGWYLNWTNPGQRVLHNSRGFTGQKVLVQSTIPKSGTSADVETCSALPTSERTFLTIVNMITGQPSALSPFTLVDANNSTKKDILTIENLKSGDVWVLRTGEKIKILSNCPSGQSCVGSDLNPDKYMGLRANWREVQ